MVRPAKKTSHRAAVAARAAKKSMAKLQALCEKMNIDPPTSFPPPGCSQALAAEAYVEDNRVRTMLERLVKWVLSKCSLIQWEVPSDSEMEDYIEEDAFKKLCSMTWTKMYLWMRPMQDICREMYFDLTSSSQNYVKYLFKALRQIHARDLPFYDNLVAGVAFVMCTTAYFCHNGWDKALKHSYRVLITYFESQLRIPFSRAGGFSGLSELCLKYEVPEFLMGTHLRRQAVVNEKQHRSKADEELKCFKNTLTIVDDGDDHDLILTTMAFHHHPDLTGERSDICGEWFFKDTELPQHILKNMHQGDQVERRAQSHLTVEQLPRDTTHGISILDPVLLHAYLKEVEDFISSMRDIDRKVEGLID